MKIFSKFWTILGQVTLAFGILSQLSKLQSLSSFKDYLKSLSASIVEIIEFLVRTINFILKPYRWLRDVFFEVLPFNISPEWHDVIVVSLLSFVFPLIFFVNWIVNHRIERLMDLHKAVLYSLTKKVTEKNIKIIVNYHKVSMISMDEYLCKIANELLMDVNLAIKQNKSPNYVEQIRLEKLYYYNTNIKPKFDILKKSRIFRNIKLHKQKAIAGIILMFILLFEEGYYSTFSNVAELFKNFLVGFLISLFIMVIFGVIIIYFVMKKRGNSIEKLKHLIFKNKKDRIRNIEINKFLKKEYFKLVKQRVLK